MKVFLKIQKIGNIMYLHRRYKVFFRMKEAAFSLVEVAMSLAIFGVGIIPIIGLLVAGMDISRKAVDTQVLDRITQQVFPLTKETPSNFKVFTDQGFPATASQIQVFRADWSEVTLSRNTDTRNAIRSLVNNRYYEIVVLHIPSNRVV